MPFLTTEVKCPVRVYDMNMPLLLGRDNLMAITDSMDIEFEQTAGNGEGQGSLVCCSPRGHKESDPTEWLNSNNKA